MANRMPGPVFVSVNDQIAIHGRFRANDVALTEGSRSLTWSEYNARANRIGHALLKRGTVRGDRVALLVTNTIWAHELLLGIWRAGAVAVPLSPLLTPDSLATMLEDCDARCLFVSPEFMELATSAGSRVPVIGESGEFHESAANSPEQIPTTQPTASDAAVIIYSSGTTGTPKGIAHNHESRLKFAAYFAAEFRFHYHSVALSCIPIHSNGAWLGWLPAKWMGARTVILKTFSADPYLEAIRVHSPTHGFAVPTMAAALLQHPDVEKVGLSCFECLITAGSPMPAATKKAMQRLTNDSLYELWGLTEGVATIMSPQDMKTRPESVGRPVLGCDIRLIDGDGNDITSSGTGEIVGYSGGMMTDYWNRDDANASALWSDSEHRPYIRTGDIGEFDSEGYLTLRGRKKDMILSGGVNVYPVDIEARLLEHDAVLEAAVIGVDHPKWGETPVAIVRLKAPDFADAASLAEWANARLAKHQRLHAVQIRVDEFPRNSMGKVLKQEIRAEYLACSSKS